MIRINTTISVSFLLLACLLFESLTLKVESNQAIVPINVTVLGKLIITDAENDTKSGENPTLNVNLKLTPDLSDSVISGSSSVRIRTNLNSWKLTAKRLEEGGSLVNLTPEDISLAFIVSAGGKANQSAGKLVTPFDTKTDLSKISSNSETDIIHGLSKTSAERDPKNTDNWFQLTSNYSISPDFYYETGDWSTTVTYNLVSP